MSEHRLLIGACDWRYPEWVGSFYPDDLPEEWKLGFYSNEFRVVMLPADLELDAEIGEELIEDSGENLLFLVEINSPESALERIEVCHRMDDRCGGIVLQAEAFTLEQIASVLKKCRPLPVSVCVEQGVKKEAISEFLGETVSLSWDGQGQPPRAGELNLVRVSDANITPRDMRQIIEQALKMGGFDGLTVLLLEGTPPAIDSLRNAGVILDLL